MEMVKNPTSILELKKRIGIVSTVKQVNTGYVLMCLKNEDAELRRFVNGKEKKEEKIYVGYMMFDGFDSFINELKKYVGTEEVYLSSKFAKVLVNYFKAIA